jgi:hypothetical protein
MMEKLTREETKARRGAKLYDGEEAWSSIYYSMLSGYG